MYFRDADACVLVYDVTDRDSFSNLRNLWWKDLQEKAPSNLTIAVVGNKSDLKPHQSNVTE